MAATTKITGKSIEITAIDADWDMQASGGLTNPATAGVQGSAVEYVNGPKIESIQFNPGAADDVLVVKEKNASGATIFKAKGSATTDQRCKYYNGQRKMPYIDFSDCTLSAGHSVHIQLK